VDGKIHSGIKSGHLVFCYVTNARQIYSRVNQKIFQVSADLSDPEHQEPLVWEYLWNDPVPADFLDIPKALKDKLEDASSLGFIENFRRGTGHMFSVKALVSRDVVTF